MVEHRADRSFHAQEQAELNRHQHHREDDADECDEQAQTVMDEISEGELRRHPHFLFRASPWKAPRRIGGVTCLLQHLVFLWQSTIRPRDGLSQCAVFLVLIQVE